MRSPRYGYGIHINLKDKRIYIKVPNHSHCNGRGYVLLSHLIAERLLGRYLASKERVHHKDDNQYNNDPDNLQIFASQSPHAKMHGLKRILRPQLAKLRDREWLYNRYVVEYKSLAQIGKELDCDGRTVANHLNWLNIPRRKCTITPEGLIARQKGAEAKKRKRCNTVRT